MSAATGWTAPLTESQLGLLVVQRSAAPANLYTVVAEIELDPAHPAPAVRAALTDVLAVQPALRMSLHETPRPHAALLAPPAPDALPLTEINAEADDFDDRRRDGLTAIAGTGFDLGHGPLLRAIHLRSTVDERSVLLIAVHHTVFDGFSLRPLLDDLTAALAGELDTEALRPAREQALRRELEAQHQAAAGAGVAEAAAELGKKLRTAPPTVLYPRPNRPAETDFTGVRRELRLDPDRSAALDRVAANAGATPFAVLSAIYAIVLARHSGNDTVTFGTPVLARRTVGSYDLCGFFVNTLPVSLPVRWDQSFAEYLADVVTPETLAVKRNAAVPFSRIVRNADPDRSTNRNPLFSAMLAMQDSTDLTGKAAGAVRAVREHGTGTAKFDLWLGATPTADGWLLELEYDLTLLPEPVAQGLLASLREALEAALDDPDRRLADLFTDAFGQQAATTDKLWFRPPVWHLDGWLRRTFSRHADTVAVEENGSRLTYRNLAEVVRLTATGLRGHGVRPNDVVGLTTDTLTDTVVAMLAVLRIGAKYLPLDLDLPAHRLAYQVGKADCRVVVGLDGPGIPDGTLVLAPEDLIGAPGPRFDAPPPARAGGYVMFTSGSTGLPKGVDMGVEPLFNLTAWQVAALGMDHDTRFLQYAPLGFDVSYQEIVPTLAMGGTLVGRGAVDRRDLPAVVRLVAASRVTHVYLPVAALRPFVRAARDAGVDLGQLRYVCVSGEQLLVDDTVRAFFAEHPGATLINLYGPTETHAVTTHRLPPAHTPWPAHVPIGRPISGVSAQVIDRTGHLAPVGVAGELLLGGRCPATGYVNDPERTRERFEPDPYATDDARRYRTGDQVLWNEDGNLVFLGRDDHQVKIRGYRVELGEIESAAHAEPGVRQAVAVVRGTGEDRQLVLFVQPDPAADGDVPARVADRLAAALPGYMVPAWTLAADTIPTTGNGKVDRIALLELAATLTTGQAPDRPAGPAPDDPLRAELLELWAGLLGRDDLDIGRSLLEYGAHSLNVLTALSQVEQRYGTRVPILAFFRAPTIDALAGLVASGTEAGA